MNFKVEREQKPFVLRYLIQRKRLEEKEAERLQLMWMSDDKGLRVLANTIVREKMKQLDIIKPVAHHRFLAEMENKKLKR